MDDLKPCPFCGSSDIRRAGSKPHHYHRCHECGCEGPVFFVTPDAAVAAWNQRQSEAADAIEALQAQLADWRSRAEFAEAQLSGLLEMLPPPEPDLLKKRLQERAAVRRALAEKG